MGKLETAYKEELRIPARTWFAYTFILTLVAILFEAAAVLAFPSFFESPLILVPFLSLAVLVFAVMFFYPLMRWERRGSEIDRDMHLFITRLGVLAASESARKEMFDILSKMREYRSLAVEINKIYVMVDKWNVSLERACRFVAQTTPSDLLADFLNRLAHAVEGGEPAEQFFQTEQTVVMNAYALKYQGAMTIVEWMKEIFVSIVVATLFVLVFATLAPFLIPGEDPNLWLAGAIAVFLVVEVIFLLILSVVVPGENIWHNMPIVTPVHVMIRKSLYASFFLSIGFTIIVLLIPPSKPSGLLLFVSCITCLVMLTVSDFAYPERHIVIVEGLGIAATLAIVFFVIVALTGTVYIPLAIAFILSPWVVPGHYVNMEEEKIKRRDENFAAFLRSLGAAVAATSKDITVPLSRLRRHDFGPLTKNVDDLYKRLSLRILRHKAWEYYSAETLSELISKFTEMYIEGVRQGGNPKKVSQLISDNFLKIVGLRKMRYVSASTLTGLLYGLSAVISMVLYLTLVILRNFDELAVGITETLSRGGTMGGLDVRSLMILNAGVFNFDALSLIAILFVTAHASVSAVMTRIISGGHRAGALWHLVFIVWLAAVVGVAVIESARFLLPVIPGI
ncbi:MAG: type II secretion system F family protein [Thermoplasmata archaeon]